MHAADVGAAQVVDGDEVGAAEGVEVDPLDAGGVHRDVAGIAEELEPVSVRGQVDALGDVGAVEAASCRCRPGLRSCRCRRPDPRRRCRRRRPAGPGRCRRCRRSSRCRRRRAGSRCPCRRRSCRFRLHRRSVVGMVSVKAPLLSSMRTRSSPARASTAIFVILLRVEAEVGRAVVADVDLERCRDRRPAGEARSCRSLRSPDRQHAVLELGCLNLAALSACEALIGVDARARHALSGRDPRPRRRRRRRPRLTAASRRAGRCACPSRRMRFFICAGLPSSEPRGRLPIGLSRDGGRGGRAFAPWRPPVFALSRASNELEGETDVPPLASRGSGDLEAAVHDPGVRVADEAVAPLPQSQHEALRPGERHAREHAVETRPGQMEVVNVRAVAGSRSGTAFLPSAS